MKLESTFLLGLLGEASASALLPRDGDWKPLTKSPHFFSLFVDDGCVSPAPPYDPTTLVPPVGTCTFEGYAIRLDKGRVIATPYNKWYDPPLPVLFVDDDTQCYTVSKNPLQFYIDSVSGALKYTKVGWLPPSAIAVSFYHTGDNPLGVIDGSPSYLSWPSTPQSATTSNGVWLFCKLGTTGQYQIYINNANFDPQGAVDTSTCIPAELAAVNANPWKKRKHHKSYGYGHDDGYGGGYGHDDGYGGGYGHDDGYGTGYGGKDDSYDTGYGTGYDSKGDSYDTGYGTGYGSKDDSYDTGYGTGYGSKDDSYGTGYDDGYGTSYGHDDSYGTGYGHDDSYGTGYGGKDDSYGTGYGKDTYNDYPSYQSTPSYPPSYQSYPPSYQSYPPSYQSYPPSYQSPSPVYSPHSP